MPLPDTLSAHDQEINSLVSVFDAELVKLLLKAQANTLQQMNGLLVFKQGRLEATSFNRLQLRKLADIFQRQMNDLGYPQLVDAFVTKFDGQLKFFKQVLAQTLGKTDAAILPLLKLTVADQSFLAMSQADAATWLDDMVRSTALEMRNKALLSIGGVTPKRLADIVSTELGRTPAEAQTIAATTISTFYRTVADLSFQHVDDDSDYEIRFKYVGPPSGDPVIRPFCRNLMAQAAKGITWTRAEIGAMDNHQIPDVMTSGGGYNCRHTWVIGQVARDAKVWKVGA